MLTIAGKAIGRRHPLFAEFSAPPPDDLGKDGATTLRDLIESLVRREVAAFAARQQDRQFVRALTAKQIESDAKRGTVAPGPSNVPIQPVDADEAVAIALQAFEDGLYLAVLDETELRELDAQVFLQPESRLTFVRLTLLAGG